MVDHAAWHVSYLSPSWGTAQVPNGSEADYDIKADILSVEITGNGRKLRFVNSIKKDIKKAKGKLKSVEKDFKKATSKLKDATKEMENLKKDVSVPCCLRTCDGFLSKVIRGCLTLFPWAGLV